MAERTCTSTHHVFDGPDGGGKRLSEGESATCQCGNVASALRDGKIEVTVRAVDLDAKIPVSITPVRSVLSPGDTVEAKVDPCDSGWTPLSLQAEQPHPPASECHLDACTYPYPHSHGTDR